MVLDWNLEAFSSLVAICPCEHFTKKKGVLFPTKSAMDPPEFKQTIMFPCCTVHIDWIFLVFPDVAMCLHISGTLSVQNVFRNTYFLGGGNSNIFGIFIPNIGEDEPNLINTFQRGWNHQPEMCRFATKKVMFPMFFFVFPGVWVTTRFSLRKNPFLRWRP